MSIPTTATELLILLVFVVPGFVFQGIRTRLVGRTPADVELGGRILRATIISATFAVIYLGVLGGEIPLSADAALDATQEPRRLAIFAATGGFAIPAAVAAATAIPKAIRSARATPGNSFLAFFRISNWTRYDNRPTAWDVAFADAEAGWFIRIRMSDGSWFAGYWGAKSWASTYPDPPSVFFESEYQVDEDGSIGEEVEGSRGAVIDCKDAVLVELLEPNTASATTRSVSDSRSTASALRMATVAVVAAGGLAAWARQRSAPTR